MNLSNLYIKIYQFTVMLKNKTKINKMLWLIIIANRHRPFTLKINNLKRK